jgi:CRISPR-associated protein Cmr4
MHVGSGDANYGIIDKLVQRDPVTQYPIIHASSLKGALREFFMEQKLDGVDKNKFINCVFGSGPKETKELKNGDYRFFSADLFLLPVRSSHQQYYLATNKDIAKNHIDKLDLLGIKNDEVNDLPQKLEALLKVEVSEKPVLFKGEDKTMLEDYEAALQSSVPSEITVLNDKYGKKLALFGENFKGLSDNLPVIARNQLENGKSENLWYEEIVPHQSRFITYVSVPKVPEVENFFETFNRELTGSLVQVGANGSIGYGLCKFELLNPKKS